MEIHARDRADGRLHRWGLYTGIAAGLGLALLGLRPGGAALPDDAVAQVNDVPISRAEYQLALDAVATDRDSPLTAADRSRVLDRLIDEELLLQYAVQLDLVRSVPAVRAALVGAVLQAQTVAAEAQTPDPDTLRRFYEANRAYFTRGARVRVSGWRCPAPDLAEQAVRAARAGDPVEHCSAMPLPVTALPDGALLGYLGASLSQQVRILGEGEVAAPQPLGEAWYVLRVDERSEQEAPPLAAIAEQVTAEWQRRQAENRLDATLAQLRDDGQVVVRAD